MLVVGVRGDGVVSSVVVTRHRHPFEGHSLVVLGQMRRHGAVELLVVLPDGSKTLLPQVWTDQEDRGSIGGGTPELSGAATLASTEGLLSAAELVCALEIRAASDDAQQAARQPPRKEDDRAACPAEFDARDRASANPGGRRVITPEPARRRDRDAGSLDGAGGSDNRGRQS
jgi:hypothetical protein